MDTSASLDLSQFGAHPTIADEALSQMDPSADMSLSELDGPSTSHEAPATPAAPHLTRDERLRNDLLRLRRINATLESYIDSLQNLKKAQDINAQRISDSNRLLDQYIDIMWQTEQTSKLAFDPEFQGASADEDYLEQIRREKEEQRRREEEERQRRLNEEAARAERERIEQERKQAEADRAARRGAPPVRGVRGLRSRPSQIPGTSTRGGAVPTTSTRGSALRARGASQIARGARSG